MEVEGYELLKKQGAYILDSPSFLKNVKKVKAIALDWDGVFTSGKKDSQGLSSFSEADAMGINLLRYGYSLYHNEPVKIFIITGELNPTAAFLTKREHIDGMFFKIKNKTDVLPVLQKEYNVTPENLLFIFDDVLDLSLAKECKLRIMIRRNASRIFSKYVVENKLTDYITASQGGENALRECSELLLSTLNIFQKVIEHRTAFSDSYQNYITKRDTIEPSFYTKNSNGKISRTTFK